MVQLKENEVVIIVSHESPRDFLNDLQMGIIEMVKSLLSVSEVERELVLDNDTTEGCISALTLVQATLIDPKMMKIVRKLTAKVKPLHAPPA